jgi:hypothetical protein
MVAGPFKARPAIANPGPRRGATLDPTGAKRLLRQASLRDAIVRNSPRLPWVETHGYHHRVAPRRRSSGVGARNL